MRDSVLEQLLVLNPRAERLRAELANRLSGLQQEEIEDVCIDGMEENLALLCVLFFEVSPSGTTLVKSSVNDSLAAVILFLEIVKNAWTGIEPSGNARIACLNAIIGLVYRVGTKTEQRRDAVKRELVTAYFLCLALKNDRHRKPLLEGVKYDVLLNDELYSSLLACTSLHQVVEAITSLRG